MKLFVGIASSGRRAVLCHTLRSIARQTRPPEAVIVCTPSLEPYTPDEAPGALRIVALQADKGSCSQRNAILDFLGDQDGVLLIVDDDFIVHPAYLEGIGRLMNAHPDVAILNGTLVADGINGPGLSAEDAEAILREVQTPADRKVSIVDCPSIYGCNMAISLRVSRGARFDENLPLYGWQEDVDFSARLKGAGRVAKTNLVAGVHLGVKVGRTPGLKLGYSQVVNPVYLLRKGTMTARHALWLIARNVAMNIMRFARPEPYIDRRGRLRGNLKAVAHLFRGRLDPRHVLRL